MHTFSIAKTALRGLWRFRLRSALIILSAALGVAGVTVSANYSEAGRNKVLSQLRQLGTNVIVITPRPARTSGGRTRTGSLATTLVSRDYVEIRREIEGLQATSATSSGLFLVKAGDLSKNNCAVLGTEASYVHIRNFSLAAGEYFTDEDDRRAARVAVLGAVAARDLFGEESPVGERIFINRLPFVVLGVIAERGEDLDGGGADNTVYVPLSTAMHRLANIEYYSALAVSVVSWQKMAEVGSEADRILSRTHRPVGNDPSDYQILNQRTLIEAESAASKRLRGYVEAVGVSVLFIAGLGILAISWISVKERAAEIGLRRAMGATKAQVFGQFIFEAAALSVLGCAIGLFISVIGAQIIGESLKLPARLNFNFAVASQAGIVALALNLMFASIPAYLAATLDPIRALRPV
ncbi:MAG: ABC transporter permease [Steroidobacteraceae bacterium]